MTKDEALKLFYENNKINPASLHPQDRIADLSSKIDEWLSMIESEDHTVFLEALSRYTYLTQVTCQDRFGQLVNLLETHLQEHKIKLNEVLYVTVESSSGIKSGGDNVRTDIQVYNFEKIDNDQILAVQSKFPEERFNGTKAIVFVDDILGTGKTIWRVLTEFCSKYGIDGYGVPKLYYMCLSPTRRAIKHLDKNFKKFNYQVTALYKDEWITNKQFTKNANDYQIVDKYEKLIDDFFAESEHSYRMGFEKGRLLISFYYNTPNNTISAFWRPTDFNKPPFVRKGKECKRPSISELINKKKQADANTYSFAANRSNQ